LWFVFTSKGIRERAEAARKNWEYELKSHNYNRELQRELDGQMFMALEDFDGKRLFGEIIDHIKICEK